MRFLFSFQPSAAHLHLFLPTARALAARGHSVTVATAARMTPRVEQAGLHAVAAGFDWSDDDIAAYWPDFSDVPPDQVPAFFVGTICAQRTAPAMLDSLEGVIGTERPDVIVRDSTEFAAFVVGERHEIPTAVLRLGARSFGSANLAPLVREPLAVLRPDPTRPLELDGALTVQFAPRTWFPADVEVPPGIHLIRPDVFDATIATGPLPATITNPDPRPLVYITLGTVWSQPELIQPLLDGLAPLAVRVVATTGRFDPRELTVPANATVARYIANTALLPHVDVVVAHGGFTTVMGVVAAGKPMVLIPFSADHPLNATRCQDLGTSITLEPADLTPSTMRDAVERVLDNPDYTSRAREQAVALAAMPDPDTAATLLEQLPR